MNYKRLLLFLTVTNLSFCVKGQNSSNKLLSQCFYYKVYSGDTLVKFFGTENGNKRYDVLIGLRDSIKLFSYDSSLVVKQSYIKSRSQNLVVAYDRMDSCLTKYFKVTERDSLFNGVKTCNGSIVKSSTYQVKRIDNVFYKMITTDNFFSYDNEGITITWPSIINKEIGIVDYFDPVTNERFRVQKILKYREFYDILQDNVSE